MELDVQKEEPIVLVKPLIKRIDASNSTLFKGKISDQIFKNEKYLILNLSQVEFVDSSGLGVIISLFKTISSLKGMIVFCHVNQNVNNLFAITHLNSLLTIKPDEKTAKEQILGFLARKES